MGESGIKSKFLTAHMKVAEVYSNLSSAKRLKVGAIVVKDNRVISIGYNGTPAGWDNNCEEIITPTLPYLQGEGPTLKTKPEVIHAEANAIAKLARSNDSGLDSAMFITHAPCMECAKLIYSAGISHVYYRHTYRNEDGVSFLQQCNILVERI